MTTTPTLPFARRLRRGDVLRFTHPRQLCLRAERGTLWITVDGERDDIQLDAGMSRVFDGRATVLASALGGDAVLSAVSRRARPAWRMWLRRWAGGRLAAPAVA